MPYYMHVAAVLVLVGWKNRENETENECQLAHDFLFVSICKSTIFILIDKIYFHFSQKKMFSQSGAPEGAEGLEAAEGGDDEGGLDALLGMAYHVVGRDELAGREGTVAAVQEGGGEVFAIGVVETVVGLGLGGTGDEGDGVVAPGGEVVAGRHIVPERAAEAGKEDHKYLLCAVEVERRLQPASLEAKEDAVARHLGRSDAIVVTEPVEE